MNGFVLCHLHNPQRGEARVLGYSLFYLSHRSINASRLRCISLNGRIPGVRYACLLHHLLNLAVGSSFPGTVHPLLLQAWL